MEESTKIGFANNIKCLTVEIQKSFSSKVAEESNKWFLLKKFYNNFLKKREWDKDVKTSYAAVATILLDALKPDLFQDKSQENLYEDFFINGVPHEAFLILVKRLNELKLDEKKFSYLLH